MKNKVLLCTVLAGIVCGSSARASDGFKSETSHFVGNALLASATTVVVDKYMPTVKRPALTGFIFSATEVIAGEAYQQMTGSKFSVLDAAVGTIGAAVGAYATDKWYIEPKMDTTKKDTTYSVMVSRRF